MLHMNYSTHFWSVLKLRITGRCIAFTLVIQHYMMLMAGHVVLLALISTYWVMGSPAIVHGIHVNYHQMQKIRALKQGSPSELQVHNHTILYRFQKLVSKVLLTALRDAGRWLFATTISARSRR